MANQRRVRADDDQGNDESNPVPFSEAVIALTDDTPWVLVGETWVDATRIISVGPLSTIWDESQNVPEPPQGTGVAVHIDSPHPDTQFVQSDTESVEEVMGRIIDATSDTD